MRTGARSGQLGSIERDHEDLLRRLALNDQHALAALLGTGTIGIRLGDRATAQLRLAALVAIQAAPASYQWAVTSALAVGVTESELIDVLCTVAPVAGPARVRSAAAALAEVFGV
jgi:4-carboxymuconolactone decarboxylase